jgi:hypothetical protein
MIITWNHFWSYIRLVPAVLNRTVVLSLFLPLILLILYGLVGRRLGISSLFWNDKPRTRFIAAIGVMIYLAVVATLMFLSYKVDPASPNDQWGCEENCDRNKFFDQYHAFLALLGMPLSALVLLPAVLPRLCPYVPRSAPRWPLRQAGAGAPPDITHNPWAWAWGVGIWVVGQLVGVLAFGSIIWLLQSSVIVNFINFDDIYVSNCCRYGIWATLFLFLYVVWAFVRYDSISPPVAICFLLGLLAFGYAAFEDLPEMSAALFRILASWRAPVASRVLASLKVSSGGLTAAAEFLELYTPLLRGASLCVLLLLWCWANQGRFKLRFPHMEEYYERNKQVKLSNIVKDFYVRENQAVNWVEQTGGDDKAGLVPDIDALNNWVSKVTGGKGPEFVEKLPICERPKLALVAVSGGATRAAIWTAVVLDRIETVIPEFRQHLRIITGASGGMLGAAYFVKDCYENERSKKEGRGKSAGAPPCDERPRRWVEEIPVRSIEPVARFVAMRDLWRALWPGWRISYDDRGRQLENDWEGIRIGIRDLREAEMAGEIPSLILSPMLVEDGRRLLISNLDLWDMTLISGSALTFDDPGILEYPYSLSALEFFRLFPRAKKFLLSTGVRMSASFPYVSPAINLPTDPPRRVVDAGYYDNYGVQVATAWVHKNRVWLDAHTSGVVLIQIRDSISQKERLEVADAPSGILAWLRRGFQFFTSPIDGAGSARYASTIFRNDQDVWELSNLFDLSEPLHTDLSQRNRRTLDRAFFTTIAFENSADVTLGGPAPDSWPGDQPIDGGSGDVAMNWYLSDAEKAGLIGAIPATPKADSPGSCWLRRECRIARIKELTKRVDGTKGTERDGWLKQLEQVKNYERLEVLRAWWNNRQVGILASRSTTPKGGEDPNPVISESGFDASSDSKWNQVMNNTGSVMDPRCGINLCPFAADHGRRQ